MNRTVLGWGALALFGFFAVIRMGQPHWSAELATWERLPERVPTPAWSSGARYRQGPRTALAVIGMLSTWPEMRTCIRTPSPARVAAFTRPPSLSAKSWLGVGGPSRPK